MQERKIETTADGYQLNALQDVPDLRDWPFEPSVSRMKKYLRPSAGLMILNQGREGACTGFGLAAVINKLNQERSNTIKVSPRMLYEMAKLHDQWPGEDYAGSSCRGAIKGWYNMGVCRDSKWKYVSDDAGTLTVKRAKDARKNTIGAYYRIQPRITDFHAALNEAGAVFCSAETHAGWGRPDPESNIITFHHEPQGGHAFAIVGYTSKGFWVQNSWGKNWGKNGLALWLYEDWHQNILDGWVFNLALSTPQIWHVPDTDVKNRSGVSKRPSPPRSESAGHFIHLDDGNFSNQGRYWSNLADVRTTAQRITRKKSDYQHLLLFAHGGLNAPKDSATRIAAMKETFKKNGIYPYHFMYDTGLMEEVGDIIFRRSESAMERTGGFSDWSDNLLEWAAQVPGRALWREMKRGAALPFEPEKAGSQAMSAFIKELTRASGTKLKLHIAGHSTGAILLANLLASMSNLDNPPRIQSCSLLAPACTLDLFRSHYLPLLDTANGNFGIDFMQVFNLNKKLELDDQVGGVYRKSLLYFVSNSFEEETPEQLLGMKEYTDSLMEEQVVSNLGDRFKIFYSNGQPDDSPEGDDHSVPVVPTASSTHGGFDNDKNTMNSVLTTILGEEPGTPFTTASLKY